MTNSRYRHEIQTECARNHLATWRGGRCTEPYCSLALRPAKGQQTLQAAGCKLHPVQRLQWIMIIHWLQSSPKEFSTLLRCSNSLLWWCQVQNNSYQKWGCTKSCIFGIIPDPLQGNVILLPTAVSPYLRWGRCRTKEANDSAPAPQIQLRSISKADLAEPVTRSRCFVENQEVLIHLTWPQVNSFNFTNLIRLYWHKLNATASWKYGLSRKPVRKYWNKILAGQHKSG